MVPFFTSFPGQFPYPGDENQKSLSIAQFALRVKFFLWRLGVNDFLFLKKQTIHNPSLPPL
jgi:hypothetical protein